MATDAGINIRFEYQAENDLYIVYPCCKLTTEDDCRVWAETYDNFFKPLGRRVDCIFVLDMFSVSPTVGESWMRYRSKLHALYTRHTVRVYMGADEVSFIAGTKHQECATSIEAGVALIEKERALHAATNT